MVEASILKDVLKRYREGKLAHAFLLETNDSNKCYKDVIELLKNLNCPFEFSDDCDKECNECDYKRATNHDYSISGNDGTNYWNECSICGDKLAVSAPSKKGCNGNIVGTLSSAITLFGVALYFKKKNNSK